MLPAHLEGPPQSFLCSPQPLKGVALGTKQWLSLQGLALPGLGHLVIGVPGLQPGQPCGFGQGNVPLWASGKWG